MSLRERVLEKKEDEFVTWWMDAGPNHVRHSTYVNSPTRGTWRIFICDSLADEELEREYSKWRIEHE